MEVKIERRTRNGNGKGRRYLNRHELYLNDEQEEMLTKLCIKYNATITEIMRFLIKKQFYGGQNDDI